MSINLIEIMMFLIILVLVSYLMGISLRNMIDDRLSKVSLKLPKQNLVVKIDKDNNDIIETFYDDEEQNNNNENNINCIENFESKKKEENAVFKGYDKNIYSNKDYEQNIKEDIKNKVSYNNHADIDINDIDYGMANYAHPNNMSDVDKNMFIFQYPPNMTLQDYINWLWCYAGREHELTYIHLRNLNKLKKGDKIYYEEGVIPPPALEHPPITAEKYFEKLYTDKNEINLAAPLNSATGALLGYNFNDYGEFSQNSRQDGLSGKLNTEVKDNYKSLMNAMTPYLRKPVPANITDKET